jgi:acetaldehyde dehydrogenase (acetylating)
MLAATFLVLDMVRRVRRVRYRSEIQEKLASETAGKRTKSNK